MAYEMLGYGFVANGKIHPLGDKGQKGITGKQGFQGMNGANGANEPLREVVTPLTNFTMENVGDDFAAFRGLATLLLTTTIEIDNDSDNGVYYSDDLGLKPSEVYWWRGLNAGPGKISDIKLINQDGSAVFSVNYGGLASQPTEAVNTIVIFELIAKEEHSDD